MPVTYAVQWVLTIVLLLIVLVASQLIKKAHHFSGPPVVLIVLMLLALRIWLNFWISGTYYEYDRGIGATTGLTFFSWFLAFPFEIGRYLWLAGYRSKYQGH